MLESCLVSPRYGEDFVHRQRCVGDDVCKREFTMSKNDGLLRGNAKHGLDALLVYLILEGASAVILQLVQTIYIVFYTVSGGLDPFQVVLMGTLFETTIFLFEIPTGIVADVYSRRLSIIIGHTMVGVGFLVEGLFPGFGTILVSEIVTGVGGTFTSGATEAWITDEIGVERAGKAFLRAAQVRTASSMIGIVVSVALASIQLSLPFMVAGILLVGLAIFLIVFMPERGFLARPKSERDSWRAMLGTFRYGLRLVKRSRVLIGILAIGLIFPAHGEGFDHLWQIHLLNDYSVPGLGT